MSHPDDGVLQELLDGELAPADAAAVRAHLAACAACQTALAELKAVQDEADSLIERLPLDPPLQLPSTAAAPTRRLNTRLRGLAAPAVLVVGTSWVLFRTPPIMRDRVAAFSRGPAATEPEANAEEMKVRPDEAAPAPTPPAPAAKAAPAPAPAERGEAALLVPAAPAQDAAPSANQVADASEGRQAAGAGPMQKAEVTERMLTIDGLRPDSVEVLRGRGDAPVQIRQVYMLGQTPVTLVQVRVLPELAGDSVPLKAREQKKAMAASEPAAARRLAREAYDSGSSAGATISVQGWAGNVMFELSGNLSADSLAALMRRVR